MDPKKIWRVFFKLKISRRWCSSSSSSSLSLHCPPLSTQYVMGNRFLSQTLNKSELKRSGGGQYCNHSLAAEAIKNGRFRSKINSFRVQFCFFCFFTFLSMSRHEASRTDLFFSSSLCYKTFLGGNLDFDKIKKCKKFVHM